MAKIVFSKKGKIVREVNLYGFDFNGVQDTGTIQMLFTNFIMFDKKYQKRLLSNKLDRLRFRFSKTKYQSQFHYSAMRHNINSYPNSGSFVLITKYFQKRIGYKIYN